VQYPWRPRYRDLIRDNLIDVLLGVRQAAVMARHEVSRVTREEDFAGTTLSRSNA